MGRYSTFAVLAPGYTHNQIRCSITVPRANGKICGSSCGLSDFADGKTQQSIEDANIICAIPEMTGLNPCDVVEAKKMMQAMVDCQGSAGLHSTRNDLPVLTTSEGEYEIGKPYRIVEGRDVVIFATGAMVWNSVHAADLLMAEGISAHSYEELLVRYGLTARDIAKAVKKSLNQ